MINFDEFIDNHIKREEKPRVIGRYYPSEIGYCLRKVWFNYKHPKKFHPSLLKIFKMGDILHDFVVDVIKSEKNPDIELLGAEIPFKIEMKDFIVSGRIDDLVMIKSKNKKIIIEVKSIGDINSIDSPNPQHVSQIQLYLMAMKIKEGILLYVDKKNLRSKVFNIEYNELEAIKTLERFSILHNHLISGKVIEPEAKIDSKKSWMCNNCEYNEMCNGVDVNGKNNKK